MRFLRFSRLLGRVSTYFGLQPAGSQDRRLLCTQLEDRTLLSVAPVDPAAATPSPAPGEDAGATAPQTSSDSTTAAPDPNASSTLTQVSGTDGGTGATAGVVVKEVVFLDSSAQNYGTLLATLTEKAQTDSSFSLIVLDDSTDGVAAVSAALGEYSGLSNVHFLTSGNDAGAVKLGNTWLSADSLAGRAGEIALWHDALASDGNFLFYGTDVGATDAGAELMTGIAALTGDGVSAGEQMMAASDLGTAPAINVVLIDKNLDDVDTLMKSVQTGDQVFLYDSVHESADEVLGDVTQWALATHSEIASLTILSHGSPGSFALGDQMIDQTALQNTSYAWQQLGQVMAPDGVIDLYGCNVAEANGSGMALVQELATLTGADVYASTDVTGAGGDWELEVGSTGTGQAEGANPALDLAVLKMYRATLSSSAQGSETRVNTTTSGTQELNTDVPSKSVAMDSAGNYVVVWDGSGTGDTDGIYAQRYNAAGVAQGSEFRVNTTTANVQGQASVAMDANGNFVVAWTTDIGSAGSAGIRAQMYNAAGVAQGGEISVNTTTANDQIDPVIAMNTNGFVIAWADQAADGSGYGVYMQRFDSTGTKLGTETRVNTTTANDQYIDSIAMNSSGNFIITWSSNLQDGDQYGVYFKRYNSSGMALTGEVRANDTTTKSQSYSNVAMNDEGSFVITWTDSDGDGGGNSAVMAKRYNSSGTAQGSEFEINTTTAGQQYLSTVGMDQSGNFVITWSSYNQDASSTYGIYRRDYYADGTAASSETRVNTTTSGNQAYGSIGMNAAGQYVIAWSGNGTGDTAGVFFQRYTETNQAPINSVGGSEWASGAGALVFSSTNNNLISIDDADGGTYDHQVTLSVTGGTLTLSTTSGLTFTSGDGTADSTMTFTGSISSINAALAGLSYNVTPFFSGADTLTITTSDLANVGTGSALTDTDTVTINVAAASTPYVITGSYVGNGTDNRNITGIGFQPDLVLIKARTNQIGAMRTSTMSGDLSKDMTGATALQANLIQSFLSDGFQIGTDASVNASGVTYDYIVFKASAGFLSIGSYTGSGIAGKTVTGLGMSPDAVFVMDGAGNEALFSTTADEGNTYNFSNNAPKTTQITSLDSDGFTLGSDAKVNASGHTYYYVAFNELAGAMDVGGYTGTGLDNRSITGVGFQSEWLMVNSNGNSAVQHFDSQGATTDTTSFFDATTSTTNRIQQLTSNGFQVGNDPDVNANGTAYQYLAFAQQTQCTITSISNQTILEDNNTGAIAFTIGDAETAAANLSVRVTSSDSTLIPATNMVLGGSGANRTLTITPPANLNGTCTITVDVTDGVTVSSRTFTLTVTPVNDQPVRTAGSPAAVSVLEDSANTTAVSLGLSGLTYGPGGASDEASQTFTYTVTTIPSFMTVWKTDGVTQVTANMTVTLAELQGLKYKTVANANGTGSLVWTVQDSGGTANGGVDTLTESLSVTVTAVNDAPTRTAGSPAAVSVLEDSANTTAVSLGLSALAYGNGGGSDESGQTLTYKVTAIPAAMTLWLADGTTQVTANTTLTLTQLQGLKYKTVANANGSGNLTWTVQDNGGTANGGVDTLTENLSITITAVNDQPVRTAGSPAAVSVNEDSANTTAVSLGMSGLAYGVGGGSDESGQSLTYTLTGIPSCITVWLADGTTQVTANTTLTIAQLQGLKYKTVANANGTGNLTWTVQDSGGTTNGGVDLLTETLSITVGAVNDQPVRTAGNPSAVSVNEDSANTTAVTLGMSALTYGVGGGSDEAGQTLTYTLTGIPNCVTIWLADGTTQVTAGTTLSLAQLQGLKYKTVADANGTGNLTWTVQDSGGTANGGVDLLTETLSITVGAVNDQPVRTAGNPAAVSVNEDSANTTAVSLGMSALTYGVGGGGDESGQTLTYKVTAIPSYVTIWKADGVTQVTANTTVTLAELQGLKYKTVANANGTGNLTWTVQDSGGTANGGVDTLTETLSITVGAVNDQPVRTAGNPSAVSVNEDSANTTAVSLGMSGLTYGVGGGADEAGQTLTYTLTGIPSAITVWLADGTTQVTAGATLSLAQLQGLQYKTVANAVGTGNLTWTVQDSGGTANGGVDTLSESLSITVGAVNDVPVRTAGNPSAVSVNEDSANTTAVSLGMSGLTYGVGGGADEAGQTLTYTLTGIPSAVTVWLADGTTQVTANTTLTLAQLQGLKYKTVANAVGTGNLTWTVQDSGGTANGGVDTLSESLSITVGAVNDQPVRTAGNPSAVSVNEDSANSTAVSLGMSGLTYGVGGGSDEAGQTLTYTLTGIPSCITVWLADGTTQVTANTTLTIAQLQGLKYKTVANANGTGNLTWTVQDSGGTTNGGVDLLTETLSITVGAVNDQPVRTAGNPSAVSVNEDSANSTAVSLGMSGLTYGVGGGSDEAAQTLTYTLTGIPSCITVWLADGTTQVTANTTLTPAQLQGLKYKTVANAVGTGNLTWTVQDSGGTANGGVDTLSESLSITVGSVNDQPVRTAGNPAAISVNEDASNTTAVSLGMSSLTYGVGGGADEAGQTLTYTLTGIPSAITVWLADGTTQVTAGSTLSLAQLQGLQYKTVANAVGTGNLTWTVQDSGGTANGGVDTLSESLSITVGAVNDVPVRTAGNPAAVNVDEDSANTTPVSLGMTGLAYSVGGGADEAGQTLTYTLTGIPSAITVWLADGTTQVTTGTTLSPAQLQGLQYKTVANAVGTGNLTWTVQDSGGTANGGVDTLTETLSITVGAVNDVPVRTAGNPAAINVDEDSANTTAVTLGMSGLTYGVGGGADEAGQTLTYTLTGIPGAITVWLADGTTQVTAGSTLSLAQLQGLQYKTVANAVGAGNLTWTVQDSGGTANGGVDLLTETLSITVGAVNDQPVRTAGNPAAISVAEDSANATAVSLGMSGLTYGVGGGADEASQTLTYTVTAIPDCVTLWLADGTTQVTANTTLSLAQLQGLQYKTVANAVGTGNVIWSVQDSGGTANGGVDTLTEMLSITVGAVNDQPVRTAGNPAAISVDEDSSNTTAVSLGMSGLTYGVGGGTDEASQTLTYTLTGIPSAITVWLADGTTQVTSGTTLSLAQLQGLQYKTVANAVGTGNLTWTVQDSGGTANGGVDLLTETLSITVGAVNDQPVRTAGNPAAINVDEDSANTTAVSLGMGGLTYGVGGGSDEASQTLTYTLTGIPSAITVWLADGTTQVTAGTTLSLAQLQGLQYKTVANSVGTGNLTWTVQDSGGTANGGVDLLTETLSITVGAVNDQPVRTAGNPTAINVNEDSANTTPVSLGMNGLTYGVGGGSDEASQTLTYTLTGIPSAITVWLADGTTQVTSGTTLSLAQLQGLQYKTVANAVGAGNLTWTVQDSGGTANGGVDLLTETLSITVGAVNDQPVRTAGNPAAISVNEDSANTTAVSLGMGALTYGVGGGADEAGQTLTYTLTGIPGPITVWLADGTTQVTAGTTLSLAQLQGLQYKTVADAVGTGNLTWTVQDSGGTANGGVDLLTETLSITVGAVNDQPVRTAGNPAAINVNEDSANTTAVTLGMSGLTYGVGGGTDEAGQTLTYTLTGIPSAITVWLADGTTQVTAGSTLSLAQLQGLRYKTIANTPGSGNLIWTVQDSGGTANGGVDLLTETLSITVGAVNDQPVRTAGNPAAISVNEDSANTTPVSLGMSGLTYGVGGGSDEASQTLTYTLTGIPSAITVWLADGTTQVTAGTTLSLAQLQGLQYKTVANAIGAGNLTWTVQDSGGTANGGVDLLAESLSITVGAVNDQPVRTAGNPTAISVAEDSNNTTAVSLGMSGLTYGVGGGADEAGQTLTYTLTGIPGPITVWLADGTTQVTAGTTLSLAQLQGLEYKTVANAVGSGNLTWTVQDSGGTANGGVDLLTETLSITVGAVNDQPVRTAGNPAAISVNEDSSNTTPVSLGMSGLTYGVGGGADEAGQTLTYTLTGIPGCVTVWLADGTTQVAAGSTLSLAQLQGLQYKTIANTPGSGNLTWTVQDSGGTANGGVDLLSESLSITVGAVNDQPVRTAGNPAAINVNEDSANTTAVSLGMSGLTYSVGGGADEAGQTLTYTLTSIPSAITVWLADGTTQVTAGSTLSLAQLQGLTFKTVADAVGTGNLTWTVQDSGGTANGGVDTLTETLSITVGNVNDQPVRTAGNPAAINVDEDSANTTPVSLGMSGLTYGVGGGSDEASQTLTYTLTDIPSAITVWLADGTTQVTSGTTLSLAQLQGLQYKTVANSVGTGNLTWTVQDSGGTANGGVDLLTETLSITVGAVNDQPVRTAGNPAAINVDEDSANTTAVSLGMSGLAYGVGGGSDEASQTLTYTLTGIPGPITVWLADGTTQVTTGTTLSLAQLQGLQYKTVADAVGTGNLTWTVQDSGGTANGGVDTLTETLSITVGNVNDQPVRTAGNPTAINVAEDSANTTAVSLGMSGLTYGVGGGADESSQTLTYTLTGIPSAITVWLADGTTQVTAGTTLSLAQLQGLQFKTVANAVGTGNLTWTVQDSGGTANGGVDLLTETLSITVGNVNDQPVRTAGNPPAINVAEDSANTTAVTLGMSGLTYGVGGGADESSQTLTYTLTGIPSAITVWLADGTTQVTAGTTLSLAQLQGLQYKTVADAVGTDNLTWTVQDSGGTANGGVDTLTETLSITVGNVNDQPVRTAGNPAAISVDEDSSNVTAVSLGMTGLTYSVGGGADEAGQTLTYTLTGIPSAITVWLADGTTQVTAGTTLTLAQLQGLQYKTVADAVGSGNLTWTVQDSGGTANGGVDLLTESLSITVGAVNDQPVRTAGNPTAINVNEDSANTTPVSLGMNGLTYGVGGGSDEASQTLTYTLTGIPSAITVWLADGTTQVTAGTTLSLAQLQGLQYKTVANAVGAGNLTWTVQDSGGTANGGVDLLTETLSITVGAVNDQPVRTAGNPAAISVNEDSANTTAVSLGMGALTYGVGGGADEAGQTLTYTLTGIPGPITVWLADGTTQVTAGATLSLAQLQGLQYKTVADAVGTGNLTWTVQDSGGTANGGVDTLTETLSITVGNVNDQPVRTAGNPAAINVDEDSSNSTPVSLGMSGLAYSVGGGADEAGQTLTYTLTGIPSAITVWLADGTTQVTAGTTLSLAQLQGLQYKTVANAVGAGNLTWTVQDSGGTANGGVDLLTESLSITVGAVNDQPVRTAGNPTAINVDEDSANTTAVSLGMSGLIYSVGGGSDEASQTLTYTLTGVPGAITVWLADGTTQVTAGTTLSLSQLQGLQYKTVADAVGTGNLTWTAQDSGGTANGGVDLLTETLSITVGTVNDQPVRTAGNPTAINVDEDSANTTTITLGMSGLTYSVGGGADEAGQTLTYTLTGIPSAITVWLADGTTQVTAGTTLTLAQLQGLQYKTVADAVGSGNLTWTVQDSGGTANGGVDLLTETLSITVGAVNDQPIRTAGNPSAISVDEDSANTTAVSLGLGGLAYGVGGGTDEASQTLTYTLTGIPNAITVWLADGTTQVTAGSTLSLAQLQGLQYKTVADAVGTGNLTWTVQDSGGTANGGVDLLTETLSITVGDVNDQPVRTAGNPAAISVDEDSSNATSVSLGMTSLTYGVGGGADEVGQTLTYTLTGIPSCVTIWLADGTTQVTAGTTLTLTQLQGLQYKTVADTIGTGNLTWTVQDSGGTANGGVDLLTETLSITVGAVNDQPVRTAGNPAAINVSEDSANTTAVTLGMSGLTYDVGGGSDEAGQTLTYTLTGIPGAITVWLADGTTQVTAGSTLSLAQLQGLQYKTVADAVGTGNLTWTVQDSGGTANGGVDLLTETLSITVGAVNDQPVRTAGNPAAISVNEDSANATAVSLGMSGLAYSVGGGADEAGQTLTYTLTGIPSAITVWLADGTTQVTAGTTLSLAQLQGLTYKTVANAVGAGNLTWTVQDSGGTANGGVDLLSETLSITVGAVNDQPVRTAGNPAAINVDEDSANTTAVSLGMGGLAYGVGGGADESGQTLTYTLTGIPNAITVWLADGTTQVTAGTTLSLVQLQGLQYKTVADAAGTGNVTWTVQDSGGTANGGVDLLTESLSITVGAVNDQPVRTAGNPAAINVDEDSANTTAVSLGMSGLTYSVGGGSDEAGQTLTYTLTGIPSAITVWLADGTTQVTAGSTLSLAQLQGLQYKTVADAVGTGNLTWTVQDSGGTANGGVDTLTEMLSITVGAVNDQPVRTAGNPAAITVDEDSANTTAVTLGMNSLTYGVGGGSDEASQTLSYTLTGIPGAITVWLADGTTQVTAGSTLSLAQLQGLQYKTVANAVGAGNLTWTVQDSGGTANGGVDLLTESLSITVGAVNDQPIRTAGNPAAVSVAEDTNNTTAVSLGLGSLTYSVGGGSDEAGQTLTYTLTGIPSAITVWLADGTTQVTAGTTLSLAQLQGLQFKTVADAVGTGNLTWTVQDSGGTANGGVDLLTESLSITVGAVNDQPVRTAGSPTAINVLEDANNTTSVSLGLGGLSYGVGGGADEAGQTLAYTLTGIPGAITVWLADGTTQVTAGTTLSLAQLQGLQYKTVANASGAGNLIWTIQDSGGTSPGVDLLTETLSITVGNVNDQPIRTAGNPAAISVNEDSSNTTAVSLGMNGLNYGVGGGSNEAGQTLTYALTGIPSCVTVWLADGTTQVTAGSTLTLAQLQGLKYKTVADAVGTGNLTWTVLDSGGTANGGVDLLTESLSITVGAVNDQPVRTAGSPAAIDALQNSANSAAVSLGLGGLAYGVGGGSDEASQTLTYTLAGIPSAITVWLADGTTQVTAGTTLSLAQLQGLKYKTVADAVGGGSLTWTVQDSGGTAAGGVDTLTESLAINLRNDDPPTIGVPVAQTTATLGITFSQRTGNAILVQNHDAQNRPIVVTVSATSGQLTLANRSGVTFLAGDGLNDGSFTLSGSDAAINAVLDGLQYSAASTYGTVNVIATDGAGHTSAAGVAVTQVPLVNYGTPVAAGPTTSNTTTSTTNTSTTTTDSNQRTPAVNDSSAVAAPQPATATGAPPPMVGAPAAAAVDQAVVFSGQQVIVDSTARGEAGPPAVVEFARPEIAAHLGQAGDFRFGEQPTAFDPKWSMSVSVWDNPGSPGQASIESAESEYDYTRGSHHLVSASGGSGDAVDDTVTALTSTFLIYPMACDQMLPNRQIECADAYIRTNHGPVPDDDRKRRAATWERS